ncbi:MAG TPA: penicillin-binding transpeptidase domain-containing protein [Polyangia bacterium]
MMTKKLGFRELALIAAMEAAFLACAHPRTAGEPEVGVGVPARPAGATPHHRTECFLLFELGVGQVRRAPAEGCASRVPPMSTFKVPHALAALDAGVLGGPAEVIRYDGAPANFESFRRDHTLATAMRFSVLWYFQRVAERLGADREKAYLQKFEYGNQDSSNHLTSFWLYESLRISPDEQQTFLRKLYQSALPVSPAAQGIVRDILIQPWERVVNAAGEHPFAVPWPKGTVVGAKTGSGQWKGRPDVRWLVGHVARGPRSWVFVSNVVGEGLPPLAAVELAAKALKEESVL